MERPPCPTGPGRFREWWRHRPVRCVVVALLGLIGAFYAEEDWRGKRAWENAKRDLEAKGASLDYSAYIPAPASDDQNIFKAPRMAEWFGRKSPTDLGRNFGTLYQYSKPVNTNPLAEIVVVGPEAGVAAQSTDLVLRFRYSSLTLDSPKEPDAENAPPESVVIPLIVMEDVPLTDAITNLARHAGLRYVLDPGLGLRPGGPQPSVSVRWENITIEQALMAVLSTYNLQWVEGPQTAIALIVPKDPSGPKVRVASDARERIAGLLTNALAENITSPPTLLQGAQGIALVSKAVAVAKPLRLVVRSQQVPTAGEISGFFPTNALGAVIRASGRLRAEPTGSNAFRVFLGPPVYYTAADYLGWSDQFTNGFAVMREALKRPSARIDGDYLRPLELPQPNFVMVRMVTQTLAQRAQCFLLLERPQEALRELTLIHDLCRILDGKPTRGPATLVKAMINVAVTGVYVQGIADGLRLRVWRGPHLIALQRQLKEIDLAPALVAALQTERAALCHAFEDLGPRKVVQSRLFTFLEPKEPDCWQKVKDAGSALLVLAPRGWVKQNMTVAAALGQLSIDVFDPSTRTVSPQKVNGMSVEFEKSLGHVTPHNFMAVIAVPNFTRAWGLLAQNQTLASEASVACALERHRLERGDYPETLHALVPRWADSLPRDIIGGQPLHYVRGQKGTYVLYSVGWNGTDEGGTTCLDPGGCPSVREGDWVWQ